MGFGSGGCVRGGAVLSFHPLPFLRRTVLPPVSLSRPGKAQVCARGGGRRRWSCRRRAAGEGRPCRGRAAPERAAASAAAARSHSGPCLPPRPRGERGRRGSVPGRAADSDGLCVAGSVLSLGEQQRRRRAPAEGLCVLVSSCLPSHLRAGALRLL